jgi:O-acetyl-ADP-ribose deacetylase (regulator of RNase III)
VDAIVNAANSRLVGGGGVDGAIRRAGGPAIEEACARIRAEQGGCPTGSAVITGAGRLAARYVIHAVGPVWHGGGQGEAALLASAYRASLQLAAAHGVRTIAFPSISTGVYGYPVSLAARVALRTVVEVVQGTSLEEVRFVLFSEPDFDAYAAALEEVLGPMPPLHDRSPQGSQGTPPEARPESEAASVEPVAVTGGADRDAAPGGSPGGGAEPGPEPLWQTTPPALTESGPEGAASAPAGRPRARGKAAAARRQPTAKASGRRAAGGGRRRGAGGGRRTGGRRAGGRGAAPRRAGGAARPKRPAGRRTTRVRRRVRTAGARRRGRSRRGAGRGRA